MPPIPVLRETQTASAVLLGVVVVLLLGSLGIPMPAGFRAVLLVGLGITLMIAAARMLSIRARVRSLRGRVVSSDGRVCTTCGYELTDLFVDDPGRQAEQVTCPECGVDHDLAALRARWSAERFWMP